MRSALRRLAGACYTGTPAVLVGFNGHGAWGVTAGLSDTTDLFVERLEGRFALRRGFTLAPGERVLIAEDVVTTGLSTRECMACVRAAGAEVVAAACLIDRSAGAARLGVPLVALAVLDLPVYPADRLPPALAAQPVTKPGSRTAPPST